MPVSVYEGSARKSPGRVVRAEADDLEELIPGIVLAYPDLVAQADLRRGNLGGIKNNGERACNRYGASTSNKSALPFAATVRYGFVR